jgi:endonuclease/exonuclease/phosphatase family metal-dependent hydrolase
LTGTEPITASRSRHHDHEAGARFFVIMKQSVPVRVMTYNVRSLRDDAQAVAAVIRACAPDVACIQEAPRFLRWRSKCAALARESGLYVVGGGRPAGATLLLGSIRTKVCHHEDVPLRRTPGLHQRGLAMAVIELGGARFAVASMHLSLDPVERMRQVDEAVGHLSRLDAPHTILAGDVNEPPDRLRWRALTGHLRDAHVAAPWGGAATFPAASPHVRIDGIFVSAGVRVVRCGVPQDVPGLVTASDHLPVVADLRLPAR